MKRLMAFIFCSAFSSFGFAQSSTTVLELDALADGYGNCWVKRLVQSNTWKGALFANNVAFSLQDEAIFKQVSTVLSSTLKANNFQRYPKSKMSVSLYCSTAAHYFLVSVKNSETPLCAWFQVSNKRADNLETIGVYPNFSETEDGASYCFGHNHSFLIMLTEDAGKSDLALMKVHLESKYAGELKVTSILEELGIINVEVLGSKKFREKAFRKQLLADAQLRALKLQTIDYDNNAAVIGEGMKLLDSEFPGY